MCLGIPRHWKDCLGALSTDEAFLSSSSPSSSSSSLLWCSRALLFLFFFKFIFIFAWLNKYVLQMMLLFHSAITTVRRITPVVGVHNRQEQENSCGEARREPTHGSWQWNVVRQHYSLMKYKCPCPVKTRETESNACVSFQLQVDRSTCWSSGSNTRHWDRCSYRSLTPFGTSTYYKGST